MKPLTTSLFVERAFKVHGNKYDYTSGAEITKLTYVLFIIGILTTWIVYCIAF